MSKDPFDTFIEAHKEEFDVHQPSASVWNNIRFRIGAKPSSSKTIWWKVAAVVFFACSGYLFSQQYIFTTPSTHRAEFVAIEQFYLNQIEEKKGMILTISQKDEFPFPEVENELIQLNSMYQVLKEEYENTHSQRVADAMILNLIMRTNKLNNSLGQVDKKVNEPKEDESRTI